ncbi:MAG: ABC transporter ATP-binding protein [Clostridia bacterium]|nr:ABC transporter ATP-binding protein [Clostridia bacterium]
MEKVLEITGLTKKYKNSRGIEDINLTVYKGDIFGFIGPNGAGKTTTMKCITGLCRPDRGNIRIFGYDIKENFEPAMAKVGCLVETADAYDYMTAYENLLLVARYYPRLAGNRIDEALELVDLAGHKKEKAGTFSSGMKQRLALAAALLPQPGLVILDEPTNGLDIDGKLQFHELIVRLAKEQGITFFISSHLIHEMERLWNRVAIIYDGKPVAEGPVQELTWDQTLEQFYVEQTKALKGGKKYA